MVDRLLRPKLFETEPSDPNAEKLYKHWKTTFENFLESCLPAVPAGTPGDEPSLAAERTAIAANERKKRHAILNNVGTNVYELIGECASYDLAIQTLDAAYIRPANEVYNRHQLLKSKQEAGQPIDIYLQNLQRIAKTCNFKAVTAEENKNQYIRDTFIKGISSSHIRQRLLENTGELPLDQAYTQARALEQAQSQSASYDDNHGIAAVPSSELLSESEESLGAAGSTDNNGSNRLSNHRSSNSRSNNNRSNNNRSNNNRSNNNRSNNNRSNNNNRRDNASNNACYFCGNPSHDRSVCPAKNDTCDNCQKPGHWSRVCNSTSSLGAMGHMTNETHQQQFQQPSYQQYQQQPQQQAFHQQSLAQQQQYIPYHQGPSLA